ncbi:ankyrin unc44 [Fusarium coicis]|nr:ankyrin unc44 [Fusarium coicis]
MAKILLERGAVVDLIDEASHTALYYAVVRGHKGILSLLLEYTDHGKPLPDASEVIIEAARAGFVEVIDSCLQAGSTCVGEHGSDRKSTALHLAVKLGRRDVIFLLLSKGFPVDERDEEGRTSLELAAMAGNHEIVSLLLDNYANATVKSDDGKSIVTRVANQRGIEFSSEHARVVEILLEREQFDLKEHDEDDRSALHYAAWNGNWKIVSVLLRQGADPSEKGAWLWNALHHAAACGSRKVVELILDQETVDLTDTDDEGLTAMHLAASFNTVQVMGALLEKAPETINSAAEDGRRPIHIAYRNAKALKWLLQHGADVDSRDDTGRTALLLVAEYGRDHLREEAAFLLSYGADPNAQDEAKRTALHFAVLNGAEELGRDLLDRNASKTFMSDSDFISILHLAISKSTSRFANIVLEYVSQAENMPLNTRDGEENTALLLAVKEGNEDVIEKLLALGVDTELRNNIGETALAAAVKSKEMKLVKQLLSANSDINSGGGAYPTALHTAALDDRQNIVEELLRLGADINAEGGFYNTALTAAAAMGHEEIALLLLDSDADIHKDGGVFSNALAAAVYSSSLTLVARL